MDQEEIAEKIYEWEVGVIPTDTLYGLVGSALVSDVVDRIYELKRRDATKPLIVLIPHVEALSQFGVELSERLIAQLKTYWPDEIDEGDSSKEAYTIVLPIIDEQFEYLSRGTNTIAFRRPNMLKLQTLLTMTGPLVAPSANIEGLPPAKNVTEARRYFGTDVDFYVEGEELEGKPSIIIEFDGEDVRIIRD